ncbi:MAG: hypothetical protein LUC21_08175, partial [Oscillospiraceae bacterium]|nr:hypothetical protein [Oscillospiraceae bacterium]
LLPQPETASTSRAESPSASIFFSCCFIFFSSIFHSNFIKSAGELQSAAWVRKRRLSSAFPQKFPRAAPCSNGFRFSQKPIGFL